MSNFGDNQAPLLDGWISREECELVSRWMLPETGNILETGSAFGRLFDYLYWKHPNWNYVSVDPLSEREVYKQLDKSIRYFDNGNRGYRATHEGLKQNIPFATCYDMPFEDFETDMKFDVISMGMNNPEIRWKDVYKKAFSMLKDDGYIVGRNNVQLPDPRGKDTPRKAMRKYEVLDVEFGSFVISKKKIAKLR